MTSRVAMAACGRVLPLLTHSDATSQLDAERTIAARKIPFNRQTLIPIRVMTYQMTGRGGDRGDTAVLRGLGNYR